MESSRDEVYSRRVRAGKRTYYIDVRSTRSGNDFYLTITESKRGGEDEREKFKIFLYKEDFEKFREAFNQALDFVYGELGKINALPRVHARDDYQRDSGSPSMGGSNRDDRRDDDRRSDERPGDDRFGNDRRSDDRFDDNRRSDDRRKDDRPVDQTRNDDPLRTDIDNGITRERGSSDDYSRDYGSHGYETRED